MLGKYPHIKRQLIKLDICAEMMKHTTARVFPGIIQPEPNNLTVAITSHCNLRCIGCRYGRDFMLDQQLSLSMMRNLLDDARQHGLTTVRLYGGEPLLHADLPQMVEYCLKLGLRVYITTIDSVNKYSILLNSVLFSGHEYYRCPHTQSTNAVRTS